MNHLVCFRSKTYLCKCNINTWYVNLLEFENLLVSVSFVIHKHNENCKFYTTYQERSPKRSIQYLLDKWRLKSRQILKDSFQFDELKYIDNEDDESEVKVNAGTLSSVFLLEISSIDVPFAK